MGRRSGGGGFRSAPRPRPVAVPARSSAPQAVKNVPPPATAKANVGVVSVISNIGSNIVDGLGFGVGSSFARRGVDYVMGPRTFRTETVVTSPVANAATTCYIHNNAFLDCVNSFESDISRCQFYMDMLTQCKNNSGQVMMADENNSSSLSIISS